MLDLGTPDDFRGDPYGWLTNQMSHVLAGLAGAWLVALVVRTIGFDVDTAASVWRRRSGARLRRARGAGSSAAAARSATAWRTSPSCSPARSGPPRAARCRSGSPSPAASPVGTAAAAATAASIDATAAQGLSPMSAPFGPKATATAEAGDLLMITRGTGAALEVEKIDPTAAATAALIAAGIDAYLGGDDWRTGGGGAPAGRATILNGSSARRRAAPESNGDFYIRTGVWTIYGPKAAGAWGAPTSLIGTSGPTAPTGATAATPTARSSCPGLVLPASGTGANGDFYFATGSRTLYGPKAAGAWGSGVSLAGSNGSERRRGQPAQDRDRASSGSMSATPTGPSWSLLSAHQGDPGADGDDGADGSNGTQRRNGAPLAGVNPQTGTSYTLVLADASKLVECANAACHHPDRAAEQRRRLPGRHRRARRPGRRPGR